MIEKVKRNALIKFDQTTLPAFKIDLSVSPFKYIHPINQKIFNYELKIKTLDLDRKELILTYNNENSTLYDYLNDSLTKYRKSYFLGNFLIKKWKRWGTISQFSMQKVQMGSVSPIRARYNLGPIGAMYSKDFFSFINNLSFYILPTIEYFSFDQIQNNNILKKNDSHMRNIFFFEITFDLRKSLSLSTQITLAPKIDLFDFNLDIKETRRDFSLKLDFSISNTFSLSLFQNYSYDITRKNNLNRTENLITQSLYLNFQYTTSGD